MGIIELVTEYRSAYLSGLSVTLQLCSVAWGLGLLGGGLLALAAEWWPRLVGWPTIATARVTEAVPILVLLFWLHYPIQSAMGVVIDPFVTTASLLAVLNALSVFGILNRSILNVSPELVEVAVVCGVSRRRRFWSIKVPLALRACLGPLTSAQVNVLQLSIFGSLISVPELFRVSQRINAQVYQPVEVYSGVALFFLVVCLPVNLFARHLEWRLR